MDRVINIGKVINIPKQEKGTGKRDIPPTPPIEKKGKGKETDGVLCRTVFRARTREGRALLTRELDAILDEAVRCFHGTPTDRRIWAAIAWRVGIRNFHEAVIAKFSEDTHDRPPANRAAAFQAFLNAHFPKGGRQ